MGKNIKYLKNKLLEVQEYLATEAAHDALTEVESFILLNFQSESFDGRKWKQRDVDVNPDKYSIQQRRKSKGRAILMQSGNLRDSLVKNNYTVGSTAHVVSDLPYAAIHNNGGKAGRNHGATIPKRQFIGESQTLISNVQNAITNNIINIIDR